MGKYLDIAKSVTHYDKNDRYDQRSTVTRTEDPTRNQQSTFGRICRFGRSFSKLERRCPEHIELDTWQQAVEDARRFLARWQDQAEKLGWTARDLFGLAKVPDNPAAGYSRLSRY